MKVDHFNISFIIVFSITRSCERADIICPRLTPVRERPTEIHGMFNVLFALLSHPTYTPHKAIWLFLDVIIACHHAIMQSAILLSQVRPSVCLTVSK